MMSWRGRVGHQLFPPPPDLGYHQQLQTPAPSPTSCLELCQIFFFSQHSKHFHSQSSSQSSRTPEYNKPPCTCNSARHLRNFETKGKQTKRGQQHALHAPCTQRDCKHSPFCRCAREHNASCCGAPPRWGRADAERLLPALRF